MFTSDLNAAVAGSFDGGAAEVVVDEVGGLGVPLVDELGFGDCSPSLTVPLGVAATLDADAATLRLRTPALL